MNVFPVRLFALLALAAAFASCTATEKAPTEPYTPNRGPNSTLETMRPIKENSIRAY